MDLEDIYQNIEIYDIKDTPTPQTQNHRQDEGGQAQKCRGSRCLVLMTACLGLICVLLLVFIILQHISTAKRESLFESHKNTVEELNQTISSLQDNYTDLMTEKDLLKNSLNSMSQKKLELETRVDNLTAEKSQLQRSVDSLSQKKTELQTELRKLYEQGKDRFSISSEMKSWSESRQYCRDHGGDLVIINNEEKQRFLSSFFKDRVWIGLTDIENEGRMKWMDNSPLNEGFCNKLTLFFRFWYEDEPNNAGGDEDCVELMPSGTTRSWNDLKCSEQRKGICEK